MAHRISNMLVISLCWLVTCLLSFEKPDPLLLIKIPTRSRPEKFFRVLDTYYSLLSNKICFRVLIVCDADDPSMNNPVVIERLKSYPNLSLIFSNHRGKIYAYNAGLNNIEFDILLLASDELEPLIKDFDCIIADRMQKAWPNFDGVLHFCSNDNSKYEVNSVPVIGKNWFKLFGYAFNDAYKSCFAHTELTLISRILCKEYYEHLKMFSYTFCDDDLCKKNQDFWNHDKDVFAQRQQTFFGLSESCIDQQEEKMWSILICTLNERKHLFIKLHEKLLKQIKENNLQNQVEVKFFCDNRGEHTTGYKRSLLLMQSKAKYICYIDDDDEISDDYVIEIYKRLCKNPDCVGMRLVITFDGKNPAPVIHSLQCKEYCVKNGVYLRTPNHLNPIKRRIAVQCSFKDICYGEDYDWAQQLVRLNLLKIEEDWNKTCYFYNYISNK